MKIKTVSKSYREVMALERCRHTLPIKPNLLLKLLVRAVSASDLRATQFSFKTYKMEQLSYKQPCLILMNHSSFIDLKIAHRIFSSRPFSIVCTTDGFVGQQWFMKHLGCIPTQKFVNDITLVKDIKYSLEKLKLSVLMYPEAGYSFDGTKTALPSSLGKLIKYLNVPVVTVITHGAFARDPLYNCLQLRKVKVSADVTYLLSPEEASQMSVDEINSLLDKQFSFDNFKWQYDNKVEIDEPFRADGLNRILYKCPACLGEGCMVGKGTSIKCEKCGKEYELTKLGRLRAASGETELSHIPDWYRWERDEVRREITDGSYRLDIEVDIKMMVDYKCLYSVGSGRLVHTYDGFHLTGCDGELDYFQKPTASYTLNSDYFWYEIGDVICIGDREKLFYCFPKNSGDVVAKTRLAAEEIFKLGKVHP